MQRIFFPLGKVAGERPKQQQPARRFQELCSCVRLEPRVVGTAGPQATRTAQRACRWARRVHATRLSMKNQSASRNRRALNACVLDRCAVRGSGGGKKLVRPGGTGKGQREDRARKARLRAGEEPCPEGHSGMGAGTAGCRAAYGPEMILLLPISGPYWAVNQKGDSRPNRTWRGPSRANASTSQGALEPEAERTAVKTP